MGIVPLHIPLYREEAQRQPDGTVIFRLRSKAPAAAALAAPGKNVSHAGGSLSSAIAVSGSAHERSTASASLTSGTALTAKGISKSSAVGAPTTAIRLSAAAQDVSSGLVETTQPLGANPIGSVPLYVPTYREPAPRQPDPTLAFRLGRKAPPVNLIGSASARSVSRAGSSLSTVVLAFSSARNRHSDAMALTTWSTVTLGSSLYFGRGSILDPKAAWSAAAPTTGDVVYYDGTNMTILSDGEIVASSGSPYIFSAVVQWSPSPGVYSELTVEFTKGPVSFIADVSGAAANLTLPISLAAAARNRSAALGAPTTHIPLASGSRAKSSGISSLTTEISVRSISAERSLSGAALTTHIPLAAVSASISFAESLIGGGARLFSMALSKSSASGEPSTGIAFASKARAESRAAAALTFATRFSSVSVSISSGGAAITAFTAIESFAGSSSTGRLYGTTQLASRASSRSAAALSPLSPSRFGWAEIVVLSQDGPQPAEPAFIEGSSVYVEATYFDSDGNPFIPAAVSYRVDDVASGAEIQGFVGVPPAPTNVVKVTSAQNYMVNLTRDSEERQVLFQIIDGYGDANYERGLYSLIRVPVA